jgi:hypothetical protein
MIQLLRLLCGALIGLLRSSARREAEILVLRHQINVLRREFRPQNNNRAGVTLPRFTAQFFPTAARGCSNFNNLRKAAAGRVLTTLEFYNGPFCCGPTI